MHFFAKKNTQAQDQIHVRHAKPRSFAASYFNWFQTSVFAARRMSHVKETWHFRRPTAANTARRLWCAFQAAPSDLPSQTRL